jgi:hypothetical protein
MGRGNQQAIGGYSKSDVPDINTCLELTDAELLSLLL